MAKHVCTVIGALCSGCIHICVQKRPRDVSEDLKLTWLANDH